MSREITAAQRDWLAGEIDAWHGLGLLTGEQARDVLGLYTTAEQFGKRRQSRRLTTLLALSVPAGGAGGLPARRLQLAGDAGAVEGGADPRRVGRRARGGARPALPGGAGGGVGGGASCSAA